MKKTILLLTLFLLIFEGFSCSSNFIVPAKYYIDKKDLSNAEKYIVKEININPNSAEAYYLLGYVKAEQDSITKMEEYFSKSLQISDFYKDKIEEARAFYNKK